MIAENTKNVNKKSIIIVVVVVVIIAILCLVIFLIKNKHSNSLSNIEKQTYDRVIGFIETGDFYNPKEVRILEAIIEYKYDDTKREYSDNLEDIYVKISGTNKVSGTINKCYHIYYSDYEKAWDSRDEECSRIYKSGTGYEQLSKTSIKNINLAIKDYWGELGL